MEVVMSALKYFSRDPDRELPLCKPCTGILSMFTQGLDSYMLHETIGSLISASTSCGLCRLIRWQLRRVLPAAASEISNISSRPITLIKHKTRGRIWIQAYGTNLKELQWIADPEPLALALDIPLAYPKIESASLDLLATNVEDCFYGRRACSKSSNLTFNFGKTADPPLLPRRIIDVGDVKQQGSFLLRLHESAIGERANYVTFSHRWGKKIFFKTTLGNIRAHRKSIEINALPQSFKDAVIVTQKLEVRYLWIDALCIIQDDHSDWIEQAPLMGKIYQNSYCTIAAHSAKNSKKGFLESKPSPSTAKVAPYKTSNGISGTLCVGIPPCFEEAIDQSHIKRRAWVLQELILSHRIVHFSNGYMYWECPHLSQPRPVSFAADYFAQKSLATRLPSNCTNVNESWFDVVTDYSKCELTYDKDKLVAIAGIAVEWQAFFGEGIQKLYHSGIFEGSLPQGLLWHTGGQPLKKREGRAPSWSWASVDGHIQFMKTGDTVADAKITAVNGNRAMENASRAIRPEGDILVHASVKQACTTWQMTNFGISGNSFTRLNGATTRGYYLLTPDKSARQIGIASLDDFDPGTKKRMRTLSCLRVCTSSESFEDSVWPTYMVLLLEPAQQALHQYRRVGVGLIHDQGWFNDAIPRDILIV